MKRLLFIGTSHLGAIKEGWHRLQEETEGAKPYRASFVGVDAPRFVKSIEDGWKADKRTGSVVPPADLFLNVSQDLMKDAGTRIARPTGPDGVRGLTLKLAKFDAVVFVDLFFRYPLNCPVAFDDAHNATFEQIPLSYDQITELRLPWLGYQGLVKHKVYGTVPMQAAWDVLRVFRQAARDLPLVLMPQPVEPAANREGENDDALTLRLVRGLDEYYRYTLGRMDIRYVQQPEATRSPASGLSLSHLSRGPSAGRPGKLDPHLNADYGVVAVRDILQAL